MLFSNRCQPVTRISIEIRLLEWPVTSGCPLSAPRSANTVRHIVTNLAAYIRVALPRRFSELAVFDARLYIRLRRIDEPA